uniref:Uncharacterized protein n=1 Tax=Nelumbo nucifera TaxID=4432 RepID=A0A822YR56_NELNU|nr:TPA_asm: hypothetical protein HUJ06_005262 [Nelumbo nucifera]
MVDCHDEKEQKRGRGEESTSREKGFLITHNTSFLLQLSFSESLRLQMASTLVILLLHKGKASSFFS